MGSGKGTLEYWVAVVKPGRVMFEIAGVPEEQAREALRLAMHKLDITLVVLIMSLQLVGSFYDLFIKRVLYMLFDSYNNRLIHLVTGNLTGTHFSQISFHDFNTVRLELKFGSTRVRSFLQREIRRKGAINNHVNERLPSCFFPCRTSWHVCRTHGSPAAERYSLQPTVHPCQVS